MTVEEFIKVVTQNPKLFGEQLRVVARTERVVGGQFDGGVSVISKPVQSVKIGFQGLLLFADGSAESTEIVVRNASPLMVAGPAPKDLAP
jgi:hypothetical protein